MQPNHKKWLNALLLGIGLLLPTGIEQVASAASPVRSMFSSVLQGVTGQTIAVVTVWGGDGTTVNFIPTGETFRQIWLDDRSRVIYATDCKRGNDDCKPSVLHLRQIDKLPFKGTISAPNPLMTVITETAEGGARKVYQFRIVLAKGAPQYSTINVLPNERAAVVFIELPGLRRATLEDLKNGLSVAVQAKYLRPGDGLYGRVQNFLAICRNGDSVANAAERAGISMNLVNRLAELGLSPAKAAQDLSERSTLAPQTDTPQPDAPQPSDLKAAPTPLNASPAEER